MGIRIINPSGSPTPAAVAAAIGGLSVQELAVVQSALKIGYYPQGVIDASAGVYPANPQAGQFWVVSVAGTISGTVYSLGDWAVYVGGAWAKVEAGAATAAEVLSALQALDPSGKADARTALGLGTASVSASTDFAPALATKTVNFTATDRGRYQVSGTGIVVTDPGAPAELTTYTVRIAAGSTAVIGGATYSASRFDIVRTYRSAAWTTEAAVITGEITVNGTTSTAAGRAILGASSAADQRTALGLGEFAFLQTSNLLDSTIVPATSAALQIASVSVGSGLARGLLFIPNGSVLNSDRVFASREQSYYLWKDASNYWTISLAAGDATNGFVAAATSTTGVYQGNYVGAGTMTGTTLAIVAPALAAVSGYSAFFGRSVYNSIPAMSRIGSSFTFLAPATAANLKISIAAANNSGSTHGLQVVVVCNEAATVVASSYATHANASSYAVSIAIPEGARGKECSLATCIYDQDLASPPGGKILLKRYAAGLEAAS